MISPMSINMESNLKIEETEVREEGWLVEKMASDTTSDY